MYTSIQPEQSKLRRIVDFIDMAVIPVDGMLIVEAGHNAVIAHRNLYITGHMKQDTIYLILVAHIFVIGHAFVIFAVIVYGKAVLLFSLLQFQILIKIASGKGNVGSVQSGVVVAEMDQDLRAAPFVTLLAR